ncbi:unnamed protein product [Didymodactylos carnosus]|uniref:Interferon-induced transmembrane protein n=1 Tax=Didymodactylos carnosus TaxID=1234261 RepID=A0A814I0L5_9BILA|nr:unnamed protein product [Didymodactylos carnosus]CAF1160441.1 unnamed protein product [Didymodactylos carnosus]CAF3789424.1 unnamed protein product [Didymodactylos carnosus]CAF3972122.1 unnamed protein product [Didymodactylos carnosus]
MASYINKIVNDTDNSDMTNIVKQMKRFQQSSSIARNNLPKKSTPIPIIKPLNPNHIKDYYIWALVATIFCFFTIGPIIALYDSKRIQKLKDNKELINADKLSHKVGNVLVISSIIGAIIWGGIIIVITCIFFYGLFVQ